MKILEYKPIIGLEIHTQLSTKTKLFCSCLSDSDNSEPNTNICPVCSAMPGTLPVLNKKAVDFIIKAGLAMNSKIAKIAKWDRKQYFYPDLPKGYQISQLDYPVCVGGFVEIYDEGKVKKINLERIHLEEDAGKSIHDRDEKYSYIDFNRCGVPLIEIVSKPDMFSALEAEKYARQVRRIVRNIEVSHADMQKGQMRFDVNVNLEIKTDEGVKYTPISEIKNLNSFRALSRACEYEIKRQNEVFAETGVEKGKNKLTLLWDDNKGETKVMRTKEEASDYRFINDPDIPPVFIDKDWVDSLGEEIPKILPHERFMNYLESGIKEASATYILDNEVLADFLDSCFLKIDSASLKSEFLNWFDRDLIGLVNKENDVNIKIASDVFVKLVQLVFEKKITKVVGREILDELWNSDKKLDEVLKEKERESSVDIDSVVKSVLENNKEQIEAYKNGKESIFNMFIGLCMKETKGKVEPEVIVAKIKEYILQY